jgi:zinc protease
MKLRKYFRRLPALSFALLLVAGARAQTIHLPPHEKVVLKNGLTVLLLEKHGVPLVSLTAILKTGSAADPAGQEGLASVTADLLRKGTKKRTAQQFATELDSRHSFGRRCHEYFGGVPYQGHRTRARSFCRCAAAPHLPPK